jgi:hypothetical protein
MALTPRRGVLRAAAACGLAAFVFLGAGAAEAGLSGTRHDWFAGPYPNIPAITPNGPCSACHLPHKAFGSTAGMLWSRDMSQETTYFNQTLNPNYIAGATLLCFDCHDDNNTTIPSPTVDSSPDRNAWNSAKQPQNIAFSDIPRQRGGGTSGTAIGYYELIDGWSPDGAHIAPRDSDGGVPTGGHYWKSNPSGTPSYKRGDKLPCELCHDPHNNNTGTNEAFFRTSTADGLGGSVSLGNNLKASPNMHNGYIRTGTGREMCAACHSYSNIGTPLTMWGVTLPKPPTDMPQHVQSDTTPCTNCHLHNKIFASCRDCHAYPPLQTQAQAGGLFDKTLRPNAESYAGGAGAHQRHKDALGDAIFACEICHGPEPGSATWHNQGNGVVAQGNVNIMGQTTFWNPAPGGRATGYAGAASAVPIQAGFEFSAMAGGNQTCYGLACHGNAPNNAGAPYLRWTDKMVDDGVAGTGLFVTTNPSGTNGGYICKWCHSGTPYRPATINGTLYAPNVMGTGGVPTVAANWGAEVNGHGLASASHYDKNTVGDGAGLAGAGKNCDICHDARYVPNATPPPTNVPLKAHFDGSVGSAEKRLRDTINGVTLSGAINPPSANVVADAACLACHQRGAGGDAGSQLSHHANTQGPYAANALEGAFTRICRQCHDVHGGNWNEFTATRNLNMVGKWVDVDGDGVTDTGDSARVDTNNDLVITAADNAVVFTARTGANSFDYTNLATRSRNVCYTCHAPATGGGAGTGGGDHLGTVSMSSDERGNDCTQCHDHDFDDVPSTADAFMPSGCEGCHGKVTAGVPSISRGKDGIANTADDAPNVMSTFVGGTWMSVWDGTYWNTQVVNDSSAQHGGHGDPGGKEAGNAKLTPSCTDCHNVNDPPGTHLNGVYNSAGTEKNRIDGTVNVRLKGNATSNTSHLKSEFFTAYPPVGPGGWSQQVYMDNYCYNKCHLAQGVKDMRHDNDTTTTDTNHWSVQMGTHLTKSAATAIQAIPYPFDRDLTTNALGPTYYAPCSACHDPHGSTNQNHNGTTGSNHMVRDDWTNSNGGTDALCKNCHI